MNSWGQAQTASTSIVFQDWKQLGSWELEHDGQLRGVFRVDLLITRRAGSDFRIQGHQVFTVTVNDACREVGGGQSCYQIIGWQDLKRP